MTEAPRAHSRYAPSASKRWMNCPGSIALSDRIGRDDGSSFYAAEGTMAHKLLEGLLKGDIPPTDLPRWIGHVEIIDGHEITVDADMVRHVEEARDFIAYMRESFHFQAEVHVERKLDLSWIAAGMYGHADAILETPEELVVIDFKYGAGVSVEAQDNPQLLTYAAGAIHETDFKGSEITVLILQPRARDGETVRRARYDWLQVMGHSVALREAVLEAESEAPRLAAGDWCRWCPASHGCTTYARWCFEPTGLVLDPDDMTLGGDRPMVPDEMTDEQIAAALERANEIEHWVKAIRAEAMSRIEGGRAVPGWKRVEKRAIRKWSLDDNQILNELTRRTNLAPEQFLKSELLSPAQVEKIVGKKRTDVLDGIVEKVSSGYTLAPAGDQRPDVADDAKAYFAAAPL